MWIPIISNSIEKECISNKINEIFLSLKERIDYIKNFNFYMGKSGMFLFLILYQTLQKKSISDIKIHDIVSSLIDQASKCTITNSIDFTYYAELSWFIHFLSEKGLIDIDSDYFSEINDSLYEGMSLLLERNEYGCINGAISIALYFYYRYLAGDESLKTYLNSFVDQLMKNRIENEDSIKWINTIDYGTFEQGYNLGIAHGHPGILLFFIKLYAADIKTDSIPNAMIKIANFLLHQKHSLDTHKSFFYDVCSEKSTSGRDTRLGWCYGDLSVGYSLLMSSQLLRNKCLYEEAMNILIETTYRKDLKDIGIVDAGLCHGTSGIAHIYDRLYRQTNEQKFKYSALYWYKETIKMAKHESDYAGYELPYYLSESEKELKEIHNLSFLTGISGVGLSLCSAIYPIEPLWDECLLLS